MNLRKGTKAERARNKHRDTANNRMNQLGKRILALAGTFAVLCFQFSAPVLAQQPAQLASTSSDFSKVAPDAPSQKQSGSSTDAQNPQSSAASQSSTPQSGTSPSATSNDRLFWTLPDFLTVKNEKRPPMTTGQKFKVVARSSFDYVEFPWIGFLAGISQAENSEPGYGQGAAGYAKRYGSTFGDSLIENFMTGAVLPSALHQDPRYYELGKGGFWHRTGYAMSRIWITRSDSGTSEFNFSEIGGSGIAAAISTFSYHPQGDRNLSSVGSVWGTQVGLDTMTLVVKEFWPDIRRKLMRKPSGQ